MSPNIKKVGVGVLKDVSVFWDDLRMEIRNVADSGMMARLMLAEKYQKQAYTNLSLKTSVEDILGFTIDKELSVSDWSTDKLTDEQLECELNYTAGYCSTLTYFRCRSRRHCIFETLRIIEGRTRTEEQGNRVHNREVAHKPYEPSDGFFAERKRMANGSYGFAHP
jgi:hypothetical protein